MFNQRRPRGRMRSRGHVDSILQAPTFAPLEPRVLMAGNVVSALTGGNLSLRGDQEANEIAIIEIAPHQFQINGINDTTIDGLASIVRDIPGRLTFSGGAGDDALRITESQFDLLNIDMGKGDDELTLGDVGARRITLLGGKGIDTLLDLGANDLAHKVRGFEVDEFPLDPDDSFATVDLSQAFAFQLGHDAALAINETESHRLITDYRVNVDRRGRVRVIPVYTNVLTGLIGELLAKVTPDRQQVQIEARLLQTTLDSINKLGINTPLGMRFIDQPVLSTLSLDTAITLPDGATIQIGSSNRTEGPIAIESSYIVRPTIVDNDLGIPLSDVLVDFDLFAATETADSQSLKSDRSNYNSSDFASRMQLIAGAGVDTFLSHTTKRLVVGGYETALDSKGDRVLDTLSNPVESGQSIRLNAAPSDDGQNVRLDLDVVSSLVTDIKSLAIRTAVKKQFLQLPVIELLRVASRVSMDSGDSDLVASILTAESDRPMDNMQVRITPTVVNVGGTLLTELGIDLDFLSPPDDGTRKVSVTVDSGATATVESQVQQYQLTDFNATFGFGGIGSMKTIVNPLVTGFNYTTLVTGKTESRLTADTTFTETAVSRRRVLPFGTRFGTQQIVLAETTTASVKTKSPLLGDIPVLGALFRGAKTNRVKTELLLVVTPRIAVDTEFD